jgi:hypothetical protein
MSARHSTRRRIPFHYISTVSVGNVIPAMSSPDSPDYSFVKAEDGPLEEFSLRPVSVAAHTPHSTVRSSDISKTAHGYIATKWASEVFLERLHQLTRILRNSRKSTHNFRKVHRSPPRSSYPGADYTDLRRVGRLLVRIPKGHPDPGFLRIGWPSSWPAAGCLADFTLWLTNV